MKINNKHVINHYDINNSKSQRERYNYKTSKHQEMKHI